ncbi:MAG: hypothetical protein U9N49_00700 [Campylobacterota bacterium]|nr:hypothetical protein [Campylobacterota bacterium]
MHSIPIPTNPNQPLYITRAIDSAINDIIQNQIHQMCIIQAEGGYGKSTLIENLSERYIDTPMIVINKQTQEDTNIVDLIMDSEFTTMQNTPHLAKLKEAYIDDEIHEIELLDALQKDFNHYGIIVILHSIHSLSHAYSTAI